MAGLCAIAFLVEGAMLDRNAALVVEEGLTVPDDRGGVGFIFFTTAMTVGRFCCDGVVASLGNRIVFVAGSRTAVVGFAVMLAAPHAPSGLGGFLRVGIGAADVVPVLFRLTATQSATPSSVAVAEIATCGHVGTLTGPVAIDFIAQHVALKVACRLLAGLSGVLALLSVRVMWRAVSAKGNVRAGRPVAEYLEWIIGGATVLFTRGRSAIRS